MLPDSLTIPTPGRPGHALFSLQNRVIVIAGATGVLGESLSLAVTEAGARVAVLSRDAGRAHARGATIRARLSASWATCSTKPRGRLPAKKL